MKYLKPIVMGAALLSMGSTLSVSAQASDAGKAFDGAEKCYGYEFDDASLNLDEAIMVCAQAAADLAGVRQIDGKDIGVSEIDSISDIAGTVSMKWAALAFKKSNGNVTSDVCDPVGFAYSFYEILDEPQSSKSKEDSGANMLAGLCADAGISIR